VHQAFLHSAHGSQKQLRLVQQQIVRSNGRKEKLHESYEMTILLRSSPRVLCMHDGTVLQLSKAIDRLYLKLFCNEKCPMLNPPLIENAS
jgi:hypothetical protein